VSGDSSENGICGCGSPARCCQPAVAGGFIYADLWGELSTHLAPQASFAQSSPVFEPLLQAFPFPSTGKGDTAPVFSGLHVYLQLTWEVGLPPSLVGFSSLCHSHKLSCSWLLGAGPCSRPPQPGPACLFTVLGRIPPPHPALGTQCAPPSFPRVFYCSYCLLLSFSFFPGWRSVCPGAMLIWPRVVCGSTAVPLSSPCLHLPKPSGGRQLVAQGPSWFLRLT
jgi:hypothetical protein